MYEYRSETVAMTQLGGACNAVGAEGWEVLSVVGGGIAVQQTPLSQPVAACVVLFRREKVPVAPKRNGVLHVGG